MRTIYQYVRPKLPRMGLIFSIKTFGTIIELFLPWLLSSIIDDCAAVGDVRGAWAARRADAFMRAGGAVRQRLCQSHVLRGIAGRDEAASLRLI